MNFSKIDQLKEQLASLRPLKRYGIKKGCVKNL